MGDLSVAPPIGAAAPVSMGRGAEHWRRFDNSVNAVSFGFVATAILISMFLVMAIFERLLRRSSPPRVRRSRRSRRRDLEDAQSRLSAKVDDPCPIIPIRATEVSVLMPGEEVPTFIALPAPTLCPPNRISWPVHQHTGSPYSSSIPS